MMHLLHLVPIIIIISAVTAALKVDDPRRFMPEFLKAAGSLLGGFIVLGAIILGLSWVL